MNLEQLTDQKVKELIGKLKYPKNTLSYHQINSLISAMFGKIDVNEAIIDNDDIEYILGIYRGKYHADRFTIHIRFKETNDHLIRIDVHPNNRHVNPDGTIIVGSHIHIYSSKYDKKDAIAIPLNDYDFPNIRTIVEVYSEFVKMANIKKTRGT